MRTDILLSTNYDAEGYPYYDLLFSAGGDFVIGDSIGQEALVILYSPKGSWRNNITLGGNAIRLLNGTMTPDIKQEFISELDSDGISVADIIFNENQLQIVF